MVLELPQISAFYFLRAILLGFHALPNFQLGKLEKCFLHVIIILQSLTEILQSWGVLDRQNATEGRGGS